MCLRVMKRIVFLITTAMMVFFCPAFVRALEVEVIPGSHGVREGGFVTFDLKIYNDMGENSSFLISIDGPHLEWKMPGSFLVVLEDGETKVLKIIFRPMMEGIYKYTVRVSCFTEPGVYAEKEFSMDVTGEGLTLRNLRVDVDGGELHVAFDAISSEGASDFVRMEILDSRGLVVASSERPVTAKGEERVDERLSLKGLLAGSYTLRVFAGESVVEKGFTIMPVRRVATRSERFPSALYDEVLITVENQGNVVEDYVLKEYIEPGVTGFVTKPRGCRNLETGKECEFLVSGLMPGERRTLVYRIEHWPTYAQYVAGLIILIALGVFSVGEVTKPRIKKRVVKRKKGAHTVILEVKNPIKSLDSVIVRDFVSPLARVHKKFEHLTPVVKRSDAGTELIWKVGKMKPREVRIFSYKIRPMVGGELKMPKAYLRYRRSNGERTRVFSRHLFV